MYRFNGFLSASIVATLLLVCGTTTRIFSISYEYVLRNLTWQKMKCIFYEKFGKKRIYVKNARLSRHVSYEIFGRNGYWHTTLIAEIFFLFN
jgi:hypothetical protein